MYAHEMHAYDVHAYDFESYFIPAIRANTPRHFLSVVPARLLDY
jgi:hypothetical protein